MANLKPRCSSPQMLGCCAHVRIIALPHVRCACGSACGKGPELCVRKYVRMGIFLTCDLRLHFFTCLLPFSASKMMVSKVHTLFLIILDIFYYFVLSLTLGCRWRRVRAMEPIFWTSARYRSAFRLAIKLHSIYLLLLAGKLLVK